MATFRTGPFRAVVAATVLALAATACGSGGAEDEDGKVDLVVWASREQYIPPDEFKTFMKEHPNVTVTFDVRDTDDIIQQLQRMKDAGQDLPDVVHDDTYRIGSYQDLGLIQPIDDIVEQWQKDDPESFGQLLPTVFDETRLDGKRMGMTVAANIDILYYNVPWLKEAGVTLPFDSLEAMYDGLLTLKQARPDGVPMSVQALAGEGVTLLKGMLSVSGVEFDGATPELTSEAGTYVLDWFIRAKAAGLLPPEAISWGEAEARGAFARGQAALICDGVTAGSDYATADFDFGKDWATTLLPLSRTGDGEDGNWISQGRTWAITADTPHRAEAGQVLRYIADADNLVSDGVPLPRNTTALESPEMKKIMPFLTPELTKAFEASGPVPAAPNAESVDKILEQMFGEIVTGKGGSAEQLAAKYQAQLKELNANS